MVEESILGVDIGTGSVKAVAIDAGGKVIYTNQVFYPDKNIVSETEQDACLIFASFKELVQASVKDLSPKIISLSSAMHSILAVDEKCEPVTKAILWSDKRSSAIAEELRSSEAGKEIYEATGTPIHAMSPLCKIKWFAQNDKAVFDKAFKFISIKEFIWYQLFKEYKIDYSIASATGLFNIHTLKWDTKALNFATISEEKLSAPVPASYQKKISDRAIIDSLNLRTETSFCIGASDGCLANLGSICMNPSETSITIGTSGAVRITLPKPLINYEEMIFSYILDENNFVCGGPVNNGGNVLTWVIEKILGEKGTDNNYNEAVTTIETIPLGSKGLLFLPYLHGERAPVWDEKSSGSFVGIQAFHDQNYFVRASIEGVYFNLKEIFCSIESMVGKIERVKASGGWTKQQTLMQILSDVLNKEVLLQDEADASALGAAYLALLSTDKDFDLTKVATPSHSVFPKKENAEQYEKLFAVYQNIYTNLKSTMHLLHQYH